MLGLWNTNPSIHTRRPPPEGAGYPMVISAGDSDIDDDDFTNSDNPILTRDVSVYGNNPDQYRAVESVGYRLRDLFHRRRSSIVVAGWNTVDVTARGPQVGGVDDETHVHRVVTLTVRLNRAR